MSEAGVQESHGNTQALWHDCLHQVVVPLAKVCPVAKPVAGDERRVWMLGGKEIAATSAIDPSLSVPKPPRGTQGAVDSDVDGMESHV